MTEEHWLSCTDPAPMLEFLRTSGKVSDRKLRLFACACARSIWGQLTEEDRRQAVEVAERHADGGATQEALRGTGDALWQYFSSGQWRTSDGGNLDDAATLSASICTTFTSVSILASSTWVVASRLTGPYQPALLRDIFGFLPFRPVTVDPAWLTWNAGTVRCLTEAAYQERLLPQGTLDPGRLAVLADGLEEAGCGSGELLGHLRGPGRHYAGCWAVDILSGRV